MHSCALAAHSSAIEVPSGVIGKTTASPFQPASVLCNHGVIAEIPHKVACEIGSWSVGPISECLQVQVGAKLVTTTVGTTATGDSPVAFQPREWLLLALVITGLDFIQARCIGDIIVNSHID